MTEEEPILEASEDARKKADPLIGQILNGNYEVIDLLGEGGMAIVYRGTQVSTGRPVALKTLKTRDVNIMRRFQREMQTHGSLNHRNIVEAIDCFEFNEQSFLVMDCVNGISLLDLITRDGGVENEGELLVNPLTDLRCTGSCACETADTQRLKAGQCHSYGPPQ